MKDELIKLKSLRVELERLKGEKQAAQDKYDLENAALFNKLDETNSLLEETSNQIRLAALTLYADNGEKKLAYGVGIRIFKKLEYDADEALQWAKDHGLALNLDKASFEKIAKVDPMSFVSINEVPQVTIPFKIEVDNDESND